MAALGLLLAAGPAAAAERYVFGVLPQRSAVLTARDWNPILRWVSDRIGIALEADDPEGRRVLEERARAVGQEAPVGFLPASVADDQSAIDFYRTVLKEAE